MHTVPAQNDPIVVKQYITDREGHKTAVIIDMEEFEKIEELFKAIPPSEAWLYKNSEALESVRMGLKDASEGRTSKLNLNSL